MKKIAFIALGLLAGKKERPELVRPTPLQTPQASALGSHALSCPVLRTGKEIIKQHHLYCTPRWQPLMR